jgi:hypothetical protein
LKSWITETKSMSRRRVVKLAPAKPAERVSGGRAYFVPNEGSAPRQIHLDSGDAAATVARARAIVRRRDSDVIPLPAHMPILPSGGSDDSAPTPLGALRWASPRISRTWLGGQEGQWARVGVEGDGTCFYHSVAALLNLDGYWSRDVLGRRAVAEHFRCALAAVVTPRSVGELRASTNARGGAPDARPPRDSGIVPLTPDMSDAAAAAVMARQLCTPSAWADEADIRLTLAALGLNLIFIDTKSAQASRPYCGVHGDAAHMPTGVVVWCFDRRHFELLVHVVDGGRAVRPLLLPSRPDDAAAIASIMQRYNEACASST